MNYLNTVKYDDTKRSYTDSFGYIVAPLKSTRLSVRDNEEVEESKDNIVMLQGGQSGQGVAVSADFSKDANVDITIEPKGTGIVKTTGDLLTNTGLKNQLRLSTLNSGYGIISAEGLDNNIELDLRSKGTVPVRVNGDQPQYISFSRGSATMKSVGTGTTDLNLLGQGSGAIISMRNNLSVGGLNVRTDYPTNTGVSLEAQSANGTCNIIIQPKNGIVNVPAPLYTSNGYMIRRHSTFQPTSAAAEYMVQLDTAMENSFGSNASWSTDTFTNASGVPMKIMVTCTAMPTGNISIDSYSAIKVYASGGGLKYTIGRTNTKWDGTTSRSFTSTAVFPLGPSEYFRWAVYTDNQCYLQGYNGSITGYTQMSIIQIA